MSGAFRVGFAPGVAPDKWVRIWRERLPRRELAVFRVEESEQVDVLRDGRAHMGFVRMPVDGAGLHLIPLYREVPVVVVGREHPVAAYDEIPIADLADELLLDDPGLSAKEKIRTVAAGTGIVILPMSVARMHSRRDVVAVPVRGIDEWEVGLAWRTDLEDDRVETFIGIVRGRTPRSSR